MRYKINAMYYYSVTNQPVIQGYEERSHTKIEKAVQPPLQRSPRPSRPTLTLGQSPTPESNDNQQSYCQNPNQDLPRFPPLLSYTSGG
jgi:hypothetical protein